MFLDKLFNSLTLWTSLHLNPSVKSNPSIFNALNYCLKIDTLLGWLILQGNKSTNIDHRKQYLSLFSILKIALDLKTTVTKF